MAKNPEDDDQERSVHEASHFFPFEVPSRSYGARLFVFSGLSTLRQLPLTDSLDENHSVLTTRGSIRGFDIHDICDKRGWAPKQAQFSEPFFGKPFTRFKPRSLSIASIVCNKHVFHREMQTLSLRDLDTHQCNCKAHLFSRNELTVRMVLDDSVLR